MNDTIFFDFYGTLAGFQKSRYELQAAACADFNIQVSGSATVNADSIISS